MDLSSRTVVNLVVLALVAQVTVSQHWSYGWLPGGKRSVGELEATIRMMGTGGVMSVPEETSLNALERLNPYDVLNDESNRFKTKKHQPNN
ncbi:gonadotropin-releasing hormone 3 [Hypomesus transpacificus]|uniref:gonadotropin-releasing hormone 3 n=1 Tax=Hypomesus transpacificus TaxID=137520 RepID=UPI001F07EA61|nr:gonadotropin-releasing hormone 3 [Hypomesus transpacificus]